MVRYEAFVDKDWQDKGMVQVVVTRTRDSGRVEAGVFLVDLWCLGIKNAFFVEPAASDWPNDLARILPPDRRTALHPACARKLVEGAAAYAQALGFAPHHDYRKACRVFGGVDAAACPEAFTYGKDGKPFYVAGPHEGAERVDRVLRILESRLGAGGFHYIVPENPDALAEMARDELLALFQERPEGDAGFAEADGFFAATHVCPNAVESSEIVGAFWGNAPRPYRNENEARQVGRLLFNYWDEVAQRLDCARQDDDPAAFVDLGDEADDDDAERACVRAWCRGFLRAMERWPEDWADARDRPELRPHFATIRAMADGTTVPGKVEDDPVLQLGDAVMALYAALRPFADEDAPAAGN
jgi:yecA family protein